MVNKGNSVVVLIDYLRESYFKNGNFNYEESKTGKEFKRVLKQVGLPKSSYSFDYVYTDIPPVKNKDKYGKTLSYDVPKAHNKAMKPYYDRLKYIVNDPNIKLIIPTGPLGMEALFHLGFSKLTYSFPRELKKKGRSVWAVTLYSQEKVNQDPNVAFKRSIGLNYIREFVKKGNMGIDSAGYNSVYVDTYDKAMKILDEASHKPLVAFDTETNTLNPYTKGAKVLVYTLAWDTKTGYEIPIYHRDFSGWTDEQRHNILSKIHDIFASNKYKVMHNSKYDMSMMLNTMSEFDHQFNNVIDTKDGYYLTINQAVKESLQLTDLSKDLTTMGGYDDPLEGFVKWVKNSLAKSARDVIKDKIKDAQDKLDKKDEYYKVKKDQLKDTIKLSDEDIPNIWDRVDTKILNEYNFDQEEIISKVLKDVVIPQVNHNHQLPVQRVLNNEIDGSNFNYDWIPLSIMTPYACGDAVATFRCCQWEKNYMASDSEDPNHDILNLWLHDYPKIVLGIVLIQSYGVAVNKDYMHELQVKYQEEYDNLLGVLKKTNAGQATIDYKDHLYEIGLAEFNKPKYQKVLNDEGKPKLKKNANMSQEDIEKYQKLDALYDQWKKHVKGKDKVAFPKELVACGFRDEQKVVYRNRFKDKLGFTGTPFDIGYALFNYLEATVPFDSDYFSDASWKKLKSPDDVTWQDYSLSAKTTLKYIQENGNEEQKKFTGLLIELAKVKTLKSDFTDKLEKHLSNKDGYSHGSFSETGTETSRLSASNPNLQQLPHATSDVNRFDYKNPIKREFISRFPNGVLHNVDYANLEMRVAGLISGDKGMYDTFISGGDIHKATAAAALDIPEDEVTKIQRQQAKSLNFGILYGRGPASVAKQTGQTKEEAEEFEQKYMDAKPAMKSFIDQSHEFVENKGYVRTVPGFRRWLRGIWSNDRRESSKALRQSVNTIVQGTGTFLTNTAIYYINKYFIDHNMKSRVVITVHDSVVIDSPQEEAGVSGRYAEYIMEHLPYEWLYVNINGEKVRYPIEAEDEIGLSYNDMVTFDPEQYATFKSPQGYCKYFSNIKYINDQYESQYFSMDKQENENIYHEKLEEFKKHILEYQEMR